MSTQMILAVVAAFSLACVFCLGLWWLSTHRSKRGCMETMKAAVWLCLFMAVPGCGAPICWHIWAVSRSQNSYPGKPSQRSLP